VTQAADPPMQHDRAWIVARIPHQGRMCLLDRVEAWDEQRVRCSAASHRRPDNPLRAHGRLAAACGIEYAAQAMAVHGALLAASDARPRPGYLASVRGVTLHVGRLDDADGDLEVEAVRVTGDSATILYDFAIRAGGRLLLEGRAAIVLDAQATLAAPPAANPPPPGAQP
jgi:predicted hotdog family 3-hydroxylacyl-ACP dehydratase